MINRQYASITISAVSALVICVTGTSYGQSTPQSKMHQRVGNTNTLYTTLTTAQVLEGNVSPNDQIVSALRHSGMSASPVSIVSNGIVLSPGFVAGSVTYAPLAELVTALAAEYDYNQAEHAIVISVSQPATIPAAIPSTMELAPKPTRPIFDPKESLIGIKTMQVVATITATDDIRSRLASQGVSEGQIKTDSELAMRETGISISETVSLQSLTVALDISDRPGGFYVYTIRVEVDQCGVLDLNKKAVNFSLITWTAGSYGTVPLENVATVLQSIKDTVSSFCNDYLTENPITR